MLSRAVCFCLVLFLSTSAAFGQFTGASPDINSTHRSLKMSEKAPSREKSRATTPQTKHFAPLQRAAEVPSTTSFAPVVTYASGGYYPGSVAVADVNGDGKPDVLVANACGTTSSCGNHGPGAVGVLLGNGDGTFQTAVNYDTGGDSSSYVVVADVNGDGKPDLIVANDCADNNCSEGSIGVLLGNGDGTFQTVVTYASGGYFATSLAVADVNGDGKPDIVVVNECLTDGNCAGGGTVGVLLCNGDGAFQTVVTYSSGGYAATSLAVADVNGDGKPDIVVVNNAISGSDYSNGVVGVLLGNGDGTLQTVVTYSSGGSDAFSIALGDTNGDGKPDIVVANPCLSSSNCNNGAVGVLLGNGDGTFQTVVTYGLGGYSAGSVAVADVNGDGKPDVLVANCGATYGDCSSGLVSVLLGNGDGTFQTVVTYASGGYTATSLAVADVNGDGKPDILAVNQCADNTCVANGTVGVLINTSLTATTTALTSSQNPSNFGQAVTFTATVTGQQGLYKGIPTGTVTFFNGSTALDASSLNSSGVATFSVSTLTVSTHSITATYNGDTNFTPSTSPVLSQVVQGAIVSLSSTNVDFGNQTVGMKSTPHQVTLTNTGNITLTVSIGVTGTNGADFSQSNTCGTSVPAGGNCTISVVFKPSATGTRTAAVTITDNAPNSPQTISLSGTGVVPAVTFSATGLTFPTEVVFTTSKAKTVTLTNTGLGILSIKNIAASGPFSQTNNCGSIVNPSSSCAINVTFSPTTIGSSSGSVSVSDNAPGSPQKIALKGTGTYIQLTPTGVNFGNQPVGATSLPKKITLSNKGSVSVSITGFSFAGTDGSDFTQTNTCGTSVAGGASCFIKVAFTPSATGTRTGQLQVSDNGGGSPQKVSLTGNGTP